MSRLRYSAGGFLRAMQVTRKNLQVFVEGKVVDSFVYGLVLDELASTVGGYRLIRSDEIPGAKRHGKTGLLDAYDWLRRKKQLKPHLQGVAHTTLFIFDKDIDDLTRAKRRSPHVIYTPTYDVEGLVYRHADMTLAIAACCSVAPQSVRSFMPDPAGWRRKVMAHWREWVRLCILAKRSESRGVCNFGVKSRVNPVLNAPPDIASVSAYENQVMTNSSVTSTKFTAIAAETERSVARRYAVGREDELFKGKWLADILAVELRNQLPVEYARVKAFPERMVLHAAQTLDPTGPWADFVRVGVRNALAA